MPGQMLARLSHSLDRPVEKDIAGGRHKALDRPRPGGGRVRATRSALPGDHAAQLRRIVSGPTAPAQNPPPKTAIFSGGGPGGNKNRGKRELPRRELQFLGALRGPSPGVSRASVDTPPGAGICPPLCLLSVNQRGAFRDRIRTCAARVWPAAEGRRNCRERGAGRINLTPCSGERVRFFFFFSFFSPLVTQLSRADHAKESTDFLDLRRSRFQQGQQLSIARQSQELAAGRPLVRLAKSCPRPDPW